MADEKLDKDVRVDTESSKCRSCGSNLVFDPATQMLVCPHCGRKETFAQNILAEEIDIVKGFADAADWNDETKIFRCENCGAKVVLDKSESAKVCPFCGTAHVVESDELPGVKPNAVLPFTVTRDQAYEDCKKWAKKKWFAPRQFKKQLSPENVRGVYTPCFTFDSSTFSRYVGRIGTTHTRTVGSGKNRRTETYTTWRNISGTFDYSFDDVTISSGKRFTQRDLDKLAPYDSNNGKAYESKYLLGFMAYHYDIDITDCWSEAKRVIDAKIKRMILSQYSYDELDYINIDTDHTNVTYKYVMLPVYMGVFRFKKRDYGFCVNGTTGKVIGKTPVSWLRVGLVALGIIALIGAIVALFMFGNDADAIDCLPLHNL